MLASWQLGMGQSQGTMSWQLGMGQSQGTMDHWGLVLWGKMPFLDFPYVKCYF